MTTATLTHRVTECHSTQEWTTDPAMIEFYLTRRLLDSAAKAVAFMKDDDFDRVTISNACGYNTFQENEDEDDQLSERVTHEGVDYIEFEPEYRLYGCDVAISRDGSLRAILPFKHTSDELWADLGSLDTLRSAFDAAHGASA